MSKDGRFGQINQPVDEVLKVVALVGPTLKKWSALAAPSAFSRIPSLRGLALKLSLNGLENSVA